MAPKAKIKTKATGTVQRRKVKLRPHPDDAKKKFFTLFSEVRVVSVFGIDDFTDALIEQAWKNPQIQVIYCTDPNQDKLASMNRRIGGRSFSVSRWSPQSTSDFFAYSESEVIVVAKKHREMAEKMNVYNFELVSLEEL